MHTVSFKNPKSWSTHMPLLMRALRATKGTVVEVGGGVFSTPLLHWMCKEMGRNLITYEDEKMFYDFSHEFKSEKHAVRLIEDWDKMEFDRPYGVVFIDHHPEYRRGLDAVRFKNADIIVMHDTERPEKYSYNGVWEQFKYVYHWKDCKPWTSMVSNTIDVTKLV